MITVVIPVRDDAALLGRCLDLLAAQTRPADEIVVVDNGSIDGGAAVAASRGARVVRCDTPGIPAASAAGYDAASGDIIARLDADCQPGPEWLAAVERALAPDRGRVAVTGRARFDLPSTRRPRAFAALYIGAYYAALWPSLGHVPLFGSNMAMRQDAWRRISDVVHRADPEVHDDLDLAFHLGRVGRVRFDRSLDMQISARPFTSGGFGRRIVRGLRTVWIHWPRDFPPVRWIRRADARPEGGGAPWPENMTA